MAEQYMMFDSVDGDREVTAADFALYYSEILTNGVFYRNKEPSLKAYKKTGLVSTVEVGAAFIEGYMYRNTEEKELTHDIGSGSYPRIDRVVLRLDRSISERNILAIIKQGTPSSNPQPPSLQRDDVVYELSLAQVRIDRGSNEINRITDERHNPALAGVVSSVIEVPTDVFMDEWDSFFNTVSEQVTNAATDYMDQMTENLENYEQLFHSWLADQQTEGFVLGGFRMYVGDTPPENPNQYDRWLDTSEE